MNEVMLYAKENVGMLFVAAVVIVYMIQQAFATFKYDNRKKLRGNLVKLLEHDTNYPGHMAFANKGGEYFHGCRVARFKNTNELNHFFEPGNAGHLKLVGELVPMPDSSILCVFTNKLTNEEMEDNEEWNRDRNEYFSAKKRTRLLEQQERQEQELKDIAEQKRLAEVGRKLEARKAKIKELAPGSDERRGLEKKLAAGEVDE